MNPDPFDFDIYQKQGERHQAAMNKAAVYNTDADLVVRRRDRGRAWQTCR